jgi:hypothetical protein
MDIRMVSPKTNMDVWRVSPKPKIIDVRRGNVSKKQILDMQRVIPKQTLISVGFDQTKFGCPKA